MADLHLEKVKYNNLIQDIAAVIPGTLLISDGRKKCVQLLDRRKGQVLCEVELQGQPGRQEHSCIASGRSRYPDYPGKGQDTDPGQSGGCG